MADPDSRYMLRILLLLFFLFARWICALGQRSKGSQAGSGSLAFACTFTGLCSAGIALRTFTLPLGRVLRAAVPMLPVRGAAVVSFVVIALLLAYLLRLTGDVPRRLQIDGAPRFAWLMEVLFFPAGWLLQKTQGSLLRLLGYGPGEGDDATEEELRMLIDAGEREGTFEQGEKAMLEGILELSDNTASEMMTHRTEITAVKRDATLAEVIETALESGHSRIPVYEEDLDSIVGILYVKDLLALVGQGGLDNTPFELERFLREPFYVLESTLAGTLLAEFKAKKIQIAIVVDEYGGTSGLVSMEDLLEEIVGNIQDEYDDEEEDIALIQDNRYMVDGLAPLDDVLEFFSLEDIEDSEEYDTIGGYVLGMLGGPLSEAKEPVSLLVGDVLFTVQEMDRSRIAKMVAEIMTPVEDVSEKA